MAAPEDRADTGPALGGTRLALPAVAPKTGVPAPGCPAGGEGEERPEPAFRTLDRFAWARWAEASGGISAEALSEAWVDWATHLAISPGKQTELAWKAGRKWMRLWSNWVMSAVGSDRTPPCIEPLPQDRRFEAEDWQREPYRTLWQAFLLGQQWWFNATTGVPGVSRRHERIVEFSARQALDMLSPSNFIATNPEVLDRTLREGGMNLARGYAFLIDDLLRLATDRPEQDEAFRPGVGTALTPGKVVYRNRLIELIQYAPATETVHAVPLLVVPAWIMKYYILDLRPENSFIGHLVRKGYTVFCISWKNPGPEDRDIGFEDYVHLGVDSALEAVAAITGQDRVNALGYCLGGTLLAVAAAAHARNGNGRLGSLSFLASQVDFSEAGELSVFINESQLELLEAMMWEKGYLDQKRMAGAFRILRSRDLIWSRMMREYLMGERTKPSDLAAWSQDATRMPFRMHSEYLRHFYLNDDFAEGRLEIEGTRVHPSDIELPVFSVATERDHIAPWKSVYKMLYLMRAPTDFVLVSGGHNTGIVAPPGTKKAHFRRLRHAEDEPVPDPDQWLAATSPRPGSWWGTYTAWLARRSGGRVPPPPMGRADAGYGAICDAPGTYVLMR